MTEPLPPTPTPPSDSLPYPTPPSSDRGWAGIVSLICGIASLFPGGCCCFVGIPLALAGIVFGIIGMSSSKGLLAKIGMGLSALALLWVIVVIILQFVFQVALPGSRTSF